ncbi:MAG: VCBS repeat-containing protein [Myxococcales bacterium]|nr:VCBS repeat-containing protein [Myxococcales bacterium]
MGQTLRWLGLGLLVGLGAGCDDAQTRSADPAEGPDAGDQGTRTDAGFTPDGEAPPDGAAPDGGDLDGAAPDGSAVDLGLADGGPGDARPGDGPLPDGAAPDGALLDADLADAEAPDGLSPDAEPPCVPPEAVSSPPRPGITELPLEEAAQIGAPPGARTVLGADFEGDGLLDFAVTRGNRLEAYTARGEVRWRTEVNGVNRVLGVVDLNGDARLEVVAAGTRVLVVHDALTGALRWTLPADPLGDLAPAFIAVTTVFLTDLDRDGRTDLYVTDGSCSTAGPGNGAVYRFLDGFDAPTLVPVLGPRANGRCTSSQTLADWDGDGQVDLLLNDADGLNLFDLTTGQRRLCGLVPGVRDGYLPHLSAELLPEVPGLEQVILRTDGVRLVAQDAEPRPDCPDAPSLRTRWHHAVAARADVVTLLDVDGDGGDEVVFTYEDAAGWHTAALRATDGQVVAAVDGWALRGRLDGPDGPGLLVTDDPDGPGQVQRLRLTAAGGELQWPEALADARVVLAQPPATEPAYGRSLARPLVLRSPQGQHALALVDADGDGTPDALRRLTAAGPAARRALDGAPGAIDVVCDPADCGARDLVMLAAPDGALLLLDGALAPVVPVAEAPRIATGLPQLIATTDAEPTVIVRSADNRVGALAPFGDEALRWSRSVGARFEVDGTPRIVPVAGAPATVVVRDGTVGPYAWVGLDAATGAERWRTTLDAPRLYRPDGVAARGPDGALFVRMDQVLDEAAPRFPGCPEALVLPGSLAPDPQCPTGPYEPLLLSAWDGLTGVCRWQAVLPTTAPCRRRANLRISAADHDGDGVDDLYVTESSGLHRLDVRTGERLAQTDLYDDPGVTSGGGLVMATGDAEDPLLLMGANGPIEARGPDLGLLWAGAWPEGEDARGWLFRAATVVGDEVWTSPSGGYALSRFALGGEGEAAPVGRLALRGGAAVEPAEATRDYADVPHVAWVPVPGPDAGPALLAAGDDPWLYGLDPQGTLAWSRPLPALPGAPLGVDVDGDGLVELLVPLSDGSVLVGDESVIGPPPTILDRPCDQAPLCRPDDEDDLDEVPTTDTLCAAWVAVAEAQAYEVRITTENGAPLTAWATVAAPFAQAGGLPLVPGAVYRAEVRAVTELAGNIQRSPIAASDGVLVVDAQPPVLDLRAMPLDAAVDTPVRVEVIATDDDLIATRRLEVLAADGTLQWRAELGQAVLARWANSYVWDGRGLDGDPSPPGDYAVRATVGDRGGNTVVREVALRRR